MTRVIGSLDLLIGVLFVLLGALAASSVPAAWRNIAAEPEDFYGLLLLSALCIGVGAAASTVGWVLVQDPITWRISRDNASVLSVLLVILLVLVAAVSFWPDEVAFGELRLLLIPAIPLAASYFLLRRSGREPRDTKRASTGSSTEPAP